jgi:hypothetical protein
VEEVGDAFGGGVLGEALDHLEADPVVRDGFGPIADEFLRLKRDEWRESHAQVAPWEVGRYLTALGTRAVVVRRFHPPRTRDRRESHPR